MERGRTRKHCSRMCKTRFPSSGEGPVFPAPEPLDTSPCRQTHLDADPPPPDAGHVTCAACWEATPWTEWHTGVKTLPCLKLRPGTVIKRKQNNKLLSTSANNLLFRQIFLIKMKKMDRKAAAHPRIREWQFNTIVYWTVQWPTDHWYATRSTTSWR